MGRFPLLIALALALWIAWSVHQDGADQVFGGLWGLVSGPQYGEADRPTRSGALADQVLEGDPATRD